MPKPLTFADLAERAKDLFRTPIPIPTRVEAIPPTREEMLAEALGEWLKKAPAEFWHELDRWARMAHTQARSSISDHSMTAYALGFEDAIEQVKSKLNTYRGQSAPADPQEE
jgi:hypothetical protein